MNYCIELKANLSSSAHVTAWGKAREDVSRTFETCGLKPKNLYYKRYTFPNSNKKIPVVSALILASQIPFLNFEPQDTVFIQYPFILSCIGLLVNKIKRSKAKIVFLIHDVNFLRWSRTDDKEVSILNEAELLIVHTEAMKEALKKNGVKTKMEVIHLFDYYTDDPMPEIQKTFLNKHHIAIAGNLSKSMYLPKLFASKVRDGFHFDLYGIKGDMEIPGSGVFSYHGVFKPNKTGVLNTGWGLVWDGDSIDTCSGTLGDYLRINSSHKASLYLASGMPLIMWKESSLAQWLRNEGAAIAIEKLEDIYEIISSLSDENIMNYIQNARRIGTKLRNGDILKSIIMSYC